MKIIFHKLNDPYGEFSNFYPSKMIIDGKEYQTVEHYYQSMKFKGTEFEEKIRLQPYPMKAKLFAYSEEAKKHFNFDEWENKKVLVMRKALIHKFKIERFRNLLISTKDAEIIEYSERDKFWGQKDGVGENKLGRMLMYLRDKIIKTERIIF